MKEGDLLAERLQLLRQVFGSADLLVGVRVRAGSVQIIRAQLPDVEDASTPPGVKDDDETVSVSELEAVGGRLAGELRREAAARDAARREERGLKDYVG